MCAWPCTVSHSHTHSHNVTLTMSLPIHCSVAIADEDERRAQPQVFNPTLQFPPLTKGEIEREGRG